MLDLTKIQKQLSYNHIDTEQFTDWLPKKPATLVVG